MRTVDPELWFRDIRKSSPEPWARKKSDRHLLTRIKNSFVDATEEFWLHCSARGFRLINIGFRMRCVRSRDAIAALTTITLATAVVMYNEWCFSVVPPLQINLQPWQHTVQTLPFPAIAICSTNLVSKKRLLDYTESLLSKDNGTYTEDSVMTNLLLYAAVVTMELPKNQVDYFFARWLLRNHPDLNATELMYQLSPKCSTLLKGCTWRGSSVECSRLFAMRITALGFCCVFNGRYLPEDVDRPPKILDQTGQSNGLTVVYSESDEDIAYLRRPHKRMEVMIFESTEYPLLETGAAQIFPVYERSSVYFPITVRTLNVSPKLRYVKESWRKCRYWDQNSPRDQHSSYRWCLMECRRRTVEGVCNCIPFTLLPKDDDIICAPQRLQCLNKHKEKFMYYYPGDTDEPGLAEERRDSNDCSHCMADCARSQYSVKSFTVNHQYNDKFYLGHFKSLSSLINKSLVMFYYNSDHQEQFIVEPYINWDDAVVFVASSWVLIVNMTVLTIAELVFHLTVRWGHHILRRDERRMRLLLHH